MNHDSLILKSSFLNNIKLFIFIIMPLYKEEDKIKGSFSDHIDQINDPYNLHIVSSKITKTFYIVFYKNTPGETRYTPEEFAKLSIEDINKISCLQKGFENKYKYQRWILLFSDNQPSKVNNILNYYHMTKEKSMKEYNYNILDSRDEEVIAQCLLNHQS